MKLPFFSGKKIQKEYFLALLLRDEKTSAVIFEETEGKVRVVGEHEEYFKQPLEDAPLEEWLEVLDKTISHAESTLPPEIMTKKTIFGVQEDWVEDAKIKKDYLLRLKRVSEELNLTPIGFLVLTESIARLLEKDEGAPISAIFLEVGKEEITATLLRAGRIIESKKGQILDSLPKSADKLLHTFQNFEVFPARIILYGTGENEKLLQEFTKYQWSKTLPFLHVPNTVILPKGFDAKSVLFGAATQMGFDVLDDNIIGSISKSEPKVDKVDEVEKVAEEEKAADASSDEPKEDEEENEKVTEKEEQAAEKLGFVKGADVLKKPQLQSDSLQIPKEEPEVLPNETAVSDELKPQPTEIKRPQQDDHETPPVSKASPFIMVGGMVAAFKNTIAGITEKVKTGPRFTGKKKIIFIPPAIIAIFILFLVWYILGIKATIILDVKPKVIDKSEDITFASDSDSNFAENIIQGENVSVELSGDVSKDATGKKETGTKAKGTVTVFSRLPQSKTLEAGTTIKDSQGIIFTLDKAISIASSSGDASAEPTKASVAVTAKDVGKEANLPSNSKFSITGFDSADLVARNDSAFSGGTKKDITVVSEKDLDALLEELPKSLEQKAAEEGNGKLSGDKEIVPSFQDVTVTKKKFSKKAGDEASSVKLDGTVTFTQLAYKKDDIISYAKEKIKDDMRDMIFAKDGITYEITNIKTDDDKVTATLAIKAYLIPQFKNAQLTQDVAGKSFDEAKTILKGAPQVTDVTISFDPRIPFLPQILPRLSKNIVIITKDNE